MGNEISCDQNMEASKLREVIPDKKQAYTHFHLYTQEVFCTSWNTNQACVVRSGLSKRFGDIVVSDWPLFSERSSNAKVVGRAQGQQIKVDWGRSEWCRSDWDCSFNFKFQESRLMGSTLVVRGLWDEDSPFEWTIVGGTGLFALAQGIVYGAKVNEGGGSRLLELSIHVFYHPIEKGPAMAVCEMRK